MNAISGNQHSRAVGIGLRKSEQPHLWALFYSTLGTGEYNVGLASVSKETVI